MRFLSLVRCWLSMSMRAAFMTFSVSSITWWCMSIPWSVMTGGMISIAVANMICFIAMTCTYLVVTAMMLISLKVVNLPFIDVQSQCRFWWLMTGDV